MSKLTSIRVLLSRTLALFGKRVFVAFTAPKRIAFKLAILVLILTPVATTVYSITRAGTSANNTAHAVSPATLNFQARLLTSSGNLVPDGVYNVEFKIYNVSTAGTALWTETRLTTDPSSQQISVKNGYLSVYLGDKTALPTTIWNQQLWLTMNIGGTSGTPSWDGEMTPRIRLTSVPFAFRATVADSAEILSKNTGSFTGTVDFANMTADRKYILPDTSLATTASPGTICVYNGAASNCPAASGSAYYLQNDTVLQTQTNFHIQARDSGVNGTIGGVITGAANGQTVDLLQFRASDDSTVLAAVTAGGNLQVASSVDTRTATTLSLGNSTATAVSISKSGVTTTVNGALTVSEAATLNNTLNVTGATTLTGGATIRGLTVDNATATDDRIALSITSGGASRFDGTITNADLTAARTWTLPDVSGTFITTGNLTAINQVGTITAGTWNGTSIADAYVDDSITISSAGSVDWTALTGYPAACAAGSAITQLGDTVTCSSFATGTAASYIQNQNSAQQATSNFWISGSGRADTSFLTPAVDVASAGTLSLGTSTATAVSISRSGVTTTVNGALTVSQATTLNGTTALNDNVTVAAGKTLQLVGGNTASRPTPTSEGVLYYDTSTHQLLTSIYNTDTTSYQWKAAGQDVVLVAANDSSAADKAAADYVADGTADQVEINYALSRGSGGKVYLFPGTYTINASISIPNNTTLAGAGRGSVVKVANSAGDIKAITNSDITTGTGITLRDLKLDGNKTNNASGNQYGIYLDHLGDATSNRGGGTVANVEVDNFRLYGVIVSTASNTTITGVTANNNSGGVVVSGGSYNNVTNNMTNGNSLYGVWLNFSNNNTVTGNTGYNNGSAGNGTGIYLLGSLYNTITGNTMTNGLNVGIFLNGSTYNTFTGNTLLNNLEGIYLYNSSNSNVVSNNTFKDNGGATTNNAIVTDASDSNTITSNTISDASATTNNYAINVLNATSDTNYLGGNNLGGGSINNAGTGTIFGGQVNSSGNYQIQPAGTVELVANTNVTGNLSVSGTTTTRGLVVNTATATDDQILVSVATGGAARFNGTITNADLTAARTWTLPDESGTFCMQGSTNCGFAPTTGGTGYIQNQNASQQATSNFWISGTGRADTSITTPLLDTATAAVLNIGTTNATQINLNKNVVVASGKTLTVTAGTTYLNSDPSGTTTPTFIASSTIQNPGTTISFTRPGTAMSGDLAIVFLATSSGRTVTPPAGWTTVAKDSSTGSGFNLDGTMFYKTLTSSEPSSWSFGINSFSNLSGTIVIYRNAVIGTTAVAHSTNPGASFSTPTISTSAGATILSSWAIISSTGGSGFGAATAVPDPAVTNRTGTITGSDAFARSVVGEQVVSVSGTTTARSVTASNSSNFDAVARTIEILGSSGGTDALVVSNSTSAANVAVFKDNSRNVFTIANEGVATFQNATDSTNAFSIQNAAGTSLLTVDTTNSLVTVASLQTNSLTVNTATSTDDQIILSVATGGAARFNGTITNADLTAARTWTLPDVSGTFLLLAPTAAEVDSSANASIYINDTGGGNLLQLQAGGADKFTVDNTGALTTKGTTTYSGVATDITTGTNEDLTIDANGTGKTIVNDSLNIGASAGSGTTFTNNGATVASTLALTDFATGGAIGTAANTVDKYTSISVAQTTASQTLTVPTPTASTTYGRIIYLANIGTASFTLLGSTLNPGTTATLMWAHTNGADSWVFAGADGNGILNQNSVDQSANFRISGTGRANTALQAPLFDTATAVALGIGTSNATNITIGHNAGTLAIDGTNFDLSTAGVMTLIGGQTADITTQANQNLTVQANGTGTIVLNDTVTAAGTMTFSGVATDITTGANEDLTVVANGTGTINLNDTVTVGGTMTFSGVATDITTGTNEDLTVVANGTGTIVLNDTVTVAGTVTYSGAATDVTTGTNEDFTIDANGTGATRLNDNTIIGASAGSGTTFTNNGAAVATTLALTNFLTGGSIGSAATTVDIYSAISVAQTTGSQTLTLPAPTASTTYGRILYLANIGTSAFGLLNSTLNPGATATLMWAHTNGADSWVFAGADGTSINNQIAAAQNGDFWIQAGGSSTGIGRIDGKVLTPTVDTATGVTLNLGVTNATAISLGKVGVTTTNVGSLTVGASAGSGTLFVNNGATVNTALAVANDSDGGALGGTPGTPLTAAQSVDIYTSFTVNQTTANQTITLPNPTSATAGRIIYIANIGTASFGLLGSTLNAGSTATLMWNGTAWTFAGADGTSINNQKTAGQNGDFWIQAGGSSTGIGRADGGLQAPSLDTATAVALGIGTTNATNITIGHNAGTVAIDGTNFDLSTAGVVTLAGGQTADITTANASTANGITIKPGNSTGSNVAGGALTLQGGAATLGNANGGGVTIKGGAGVGTGAQGLVALSTSAFTSLGPLSFGADTNVNALSAGAVDLYSSITASATVSGKTLTINAPTIATVGRLLYVANVGSNDFNILLAGTSVSISLKPNTTATLIWNGTGWTAAGASSSTDLQAAYNNTLTSAGGAELVLNAPGGAADGLTIRNNATTPIVGGILEVQTSVGSNIMSVNNNATEYAANGGAETAGGTTTTFPANTWTASPTGGTQATISRTITSSEFATGIAAAKVVTTGATTANQGIADQIAINGTSTALTANLTYTVSFTVKTTSNFNTLDVVYSKDGTNTATTACKTGATATESVWSRISCTFTAPSSGITSSNAIFIRQSNSNSAARTFFIDNLSVNVNANTNLAADGSADVAANIGAGTLNWGSVNTATVAQSTSTLYDTAGSVSVTTSATAGRGVYNKLSNNIVPSNSTQYRVSFYAKGNNSANLSVSYTPDNGTTNIACQDYNAQAINSTSWTLISCYFTTTTASVTNAQVRITQSSGAATIFYVDALNVNFNNNNANNVQIGGANLGGPTTLLTLDRSSSAPIAANNDAYLGSMYYDTTTGRIQCYEADGWGACGSSPDNIITLTPEYPGAVLGGPGQVMGGSAQTPGIGVMTSEFCSSETGILVVGTLCANHEARNYYHWTSPQTSQQIYSIYVVYKLPTTFKSFNDSNTIKLTAYTDSLTNGIATLQVFRKNAAGTSITACGNTAQTINTSTGTWQQTPYDAADETTCGFSGGDNIIFKIDMKSQSNGNVYVENLDFVYTNN